jgi:peptide/nickel transport system permease protein
MTQFVVRRLLALVGLLLALTAIVFVLQRFTPADPVRVKLGANAPRAAVAAERHRLGYDDPVIVQYVHYVGGVMHGDFGDSLRTQRPVAQDIGEFLPASLELISLIVVIAGVMGVAFALLTVRIRRGAGALRVALVFGASLPSFLVALIMILVFYRRLGWLPASGRTSLDTVPNGPTGFLTIDGLLAGRLDVTIDAIRHLLLPGIAGAIAPAVAIALVLRSGLLTTMRGDFIRTARSKGLAERTVLIRHALRNSSGPALSFAGLLVASLFAGTLIVEQIVSWPGLGLYTIRSLTATDFPAIAGITLVLGAIYITVNTMVEVVQAVLDPRLRVAV